MVVLLVVCGCGRLNFEGSADARIEALSITSPSENAEVQGTTMLVGTCVSGMPITLGGAGLASPDDAACEAGAFGVSIVFTDGDGPKLVAVMQGAATVTRTFVRVTPAMLKSSTVGTKGSAGFMIDCDLVIEAPAELAAGDLLFGMIYSDGGLNPSITTPGFTRTAFAGGTYVAFWKLVTSAEPLTYTFHVVAGQAPADTCESAGVLAVFSGIDPANPILADSGVVDSNDTNVIAPGVTAPRAAILVGAWGSNGPASGFTQIGMIAAASARSTDDNANVLLAYESVVAGPTGTRTATLTQTRAAAAGLFVINGKP